MVRKVLLLVVVAGILGVALYSFRPDPVVQRVVPVEPTASEDAGQPSVLWIGDDFTAGVGAGTPQDDGYACRTASAFGWTCNLDAQAGTGYINNGRTNNATFLPFKDRLGKAREKFLADVIIVDGGRNDGHKGVDAAAKAAETYLLRLRELWPRAEVVVIAPYYLGSTPDTYPFSVGLTSRLKQSVAGIEGHLIDPMGKGWIPPPGLDMLLSENKVQPNDKGHRYLAAKFTAELRRLGLADVKVTDERGPSFG